MNNWGYTFFTHSIVLHTKFYCHLELLILKKPSFTHSHSPSIPFHCNLCKLFCDYILPDFLFNGFLFILSSLFLAFNSIFRTYFQVIHLILFNDCIVFHSKDIMICLITPWWIKLLSVFCYCKQIFDRIFLLFFKNCINIFLGGV